MKIATFNINNINKRLTNLLDWIGVAEPDVVCLQELKSIDAEFPADAIRRAGYGAVWRGQKSWNGVAILARGTTPILTRTDLPGNTGDKESRYIEAAVNGVIVSSLYAPNGNPQPGPKFNYKLAWLDRLASHAANLYAADVPVVLAGDYNVVPTDRDIYPTTSWAKDALVQPESRVAFRRLLEQGWVDAIRERHPDSPMYTFWHYMRDRWQRDRGLRIDLLLLSAQSARRLKDAGVDREVRGAEGASDHAPAWVVLRDAGKSGRSSNQIERVDRNANSSRAPRPRRPRQRPLLVIDGDSFTHRAYHGVPKSIVRRGGKGAGAIVGFANLLLRLYREERPRAVLVGWDTLNAPTYRHKRFPAYQSGRHFDESLLEQLDALPELVVACGFAIAKAPGYEADDFLAAAVATEERAGGKTLVASGDRDTFQLASENTTILFPVRAGKMDRIGPAEVRERYGVNPEQVPDFIALRGDASDKLPGARGIGPKGAAALLRNYGTLEAILAAGRLVEQSEMLRLYRSIATMDASAPLPGLPDQRPTWARASDLARRWELNQLADRLEELAAGADQPER